MPIGAVRPKPPKPKPVVPAWWADLTPTMRKTVTTRLRVKGYDVTDVPK